MLLDISFPDPGLPAFAILFTALSPDDSLCDHPLRDDWHSQSVSYPYLNHAIVIAHHCINIIKRNDLKMFGVIPLLAPRGMA
jgi:hypothetical protein